MDGFSQTSRCFSYILAVGSLFLSLFSFKKKAPFFPHPFLHVMVQTTPPASYLPSSSLPTMSQKKLQVFSVLKCWQSGEHILQRYVKTLWTTLHTKSPKFKMILRPLDNHFIGCLCWLKVLSVSKCYSRTALLAVLNLWHLLRQLENPRALDSRTAVVERMVIAVHLHTVTTSSFNRLRTFFRWEDYILRE